MMLSFTVENEVGRLRDKKVEVPKIEKIMSGSCDKL
jgi:hypothetical protein